MKLLSLLLFNNNYKAILFCALMDKKVQYAQGIVSLQISVNSSDGKECCVVVRDPQLAKKEDGYMWAGGYFFPSGNMYRAVEHIQNMQTGALLEEGSLSLRQI